MKTLFLAYFVSLFFSSQNLLAKEVFTAEYIDNYLTKENPYVYTAIGEAYINTAKVATAQGVFDTILSSEYNKKDYPVSTGEFSDISLSKAIDNGTEFIVGYRIAEGTQEYNNIKTGKEGEARIGVKVPVFSVLNNISARQYKVDSSLINAEKSTFQTQNNLRNLYIEVISAYYQSLYLKEVLNLEQRLLEKAQRRNEFIRTRVARGDLAEASILESQQQIITRQQRLLSTENSAYKVRQNFLKYINLPENIFDEQFIFPSVEMLKQEKIVLDDVVNQALSNRPDLKALEYQKKQLDLDADYNKLSKYPKVNLFAYGVSDVKYGEGIKVGVQCDIPLERRAYQGKKLEIQKSLIQVQEQQNKLKFDITTNLNNLIYSMEIINKNINLVKQEISIVEELEEIENKKYQAGLSNLFQINQREINTLEVTKKQLEYSINTFILQEEIKREMGEFIKL